MLKNATKIIEELNSYRVLNLKNIVDSEVFDIYAQIAEFLKHNLEMNEDYALAELLEVEGIYNQFCACYSSLMKLFEKVYLTDILRRSPMTDVLYDTEVNALELINKIRYLSSSLQKKQGNIFANIRELIAQAKNQITDIHTEKFPSLTIEMIEDFFKEYVKTDDNCTEEDLDSKRKFLRKHVGNDSNCQWERMFNDILEVESLAISGKLINNDSYDYLFDAEDKESLQLNYNIVSVVHSVSTDNRLFDFRLAEQRRQLLQKLNAENFSTLFLLVHIEDIIKCKIHPELQDEYDRFLYPEKYQREKTAQSETVDLTQRDNNSAQTSVNIKYDINNLAIGLRPLILDVGKYDKLARVLDNKIRPFIESQNNAQLWDVVRFYCMLYHLFNRNASRDKIASIFVTIMPSLGDAKKLSQNMAKCAIANKKKLNEYDKLPDTNQLKDFEKSIGEPIRSVQNSAEN